MKNCFKCIAESGAQYSEAIGRAAQPEDRHKFQTPVYLVVTNYISRQPKGKFEKNENLKSTT